MAILVAERYTERVLAHVAKEEAELRDHATYGHYFRWSRKEDEAFIPPERFQLSGCGSRSRSLRWCASGAVRRRPRPPNFFVNRPKKEPRIPEKQDTIRSEVRFEIGP